LIPLDTVSETRLQIPSDNARELARLLVQTPKARLVRVLGAPGTGRTDLAIDLIARVGVVPDRAVVLVDTLGHGVPREGSLRLGADLLHLPGTDIPVVFAAVRRLVASRAVSAVLFDDLLGLDFSPTASEAERMQRLRSIQRSIQTLASACLSRDVLLVVLDRVSPMGVMRSPLGFVDLLAGSDSAGHLAA
jgi:hypothetical protein